MYFFPSVEGFIDLEKEFEQNIVNSAVYLISIAMQVSNFAVNYKVFQVGKVTSFKLLLCQLLQGHPFMMGLRENQPLLICLMITGSVVLVLASGLFPEFSLWLEIVEFPYEVSSRSCIWLLFLYCPLFLFFFFVSLPVSYMMCIWVHVFL